jgi:hypothetical protein
MTENIFLQNFREKLTKLRMDFLGIYVNLFQNFDSLIVDLVVKFYIGNTWIFPIEASL